MNEYPCINRLKLLMIGVVHVNWGLIFIGKQEVEIFTKDGSPSISYSTMDQGHRSAPRQPLKMLS